MLLGGGAKSAEFLTMVSFIGKMLKLNKKL
jgi:hypothetical protein